LISIQNFSSLQIYLVLPTTKLSELEENLTIYVKMTFPPAHHHPHENPADEYYRTCPVVAPPQTDKKRSTQNTSGDTTKQN